MADKEAAIRAVARRADHVYWVREWPDKPTWRDRLRRWMDPSQGWAHGDVQPAHFIVGPERTYLIDLALARGGRVPEGYDFPFRGCLVHYEAPEISRSVLDTGEAEPTQEADVYALGASLLISATGWRAVEYPDDAQLPVQREAVANGRRRPVKAPGELGKLIDAMLSHTPEDRPTIYEVGAALS